MDTTRQAWPSRTELDRFAAAHRLGADAIGFTLDATGARPDRAAWRAFAAAVLRAAGVGSLGAALIAFVAANLQAVGPIGRLAEAHLVLVAAAGLAFLRPPPRPSGQGGLVVATFAAGGLLALYGQLYQTGADPFELFVAWALLTLPFALAAASGALWAVWCLIVDTALVLYFGRGHHGPLGLVFDAATPERLGMPFSVCTFQLAAAAVAARAARRHAAAAPDWLWRALLAVGIAAGTVAALIDQEIDRSFPIPGAASAWIALTLVGAVLAVRWRSVYLLALIAASWIASTSRWIWVDHEEVRSLFIVAAWLIVASAASASLLVRLDRRWRDDEPRRAD